MSPLLNGGVVQELVCFFYHCLAQGGGSQEGSPFEVVPLWMNNEHILEE